MFIFKTCLISAKLLAEHLNPLSEKEISQICRATVGYSCSDITSLAREAALGPLRELGPEKLKTVTADQIRPIQVLKMKNYSGDLNNGKILISSFNKSSI